MRTEIEREARLENLQTLRQFVEEACRKAGGDDSTCFDLKLAVDEACTNIIVHGYAGQDPGPIGVALDDGDPERIVVTITDRGRSFSPGALPRPELESAWSDRSAGGLGWHLIRQVIDEIDYESNAPEGNRLRLVKRRPFRERL
jgi:serine/threonine-protein kinase RsbW